ncbi:MAG: hypothetical protein O3A51_09850, partial [Verrucomicrobia bacterium]|nr:hypothetical protein [Verrucomicrobiota bacterium]
MLPRNDNTLRLKIFLLAMFGLFGFLTSMLWRIQVVNQAQYQSSESRQSMRGVRLPASRGRILDRQG